MAAQEAPPQGERPTGEVYSTSDKPPAATIHKETLQINQNKTNSREKPTESIKEDSNA